MPNTEWKQLFIYFSIYKPCINELFFHMLTNCPDNIYRFIFFSMKDSSWFLPSRNPFNFVRNVYQIKKACPRILCKTVSKYDNNYLFSLCFSSFWVTKTFKAVLVFSKLLTQVESKINTKVFIIKILY